MYVFLKVGDLFLKPNNLAILFFFFSVLTVIKEEFLFYCFQVRLYFLSQFEADFSSSLLN